MVILFAFNIGSKLLIPLDYIFSGRISMASRFFSGVCKGKIYLFPLDTSQVDLESLWNNYALQTLILDSEYSTLLFNYGIIYSIVVILLMRCFISEAIKKRDLKLVIILATSAINSLMQQSILTIVFNPCILLVFLTFFDDCNNNHNVLLE